MKRISRWENIRLLSPQRPASIRTESRRSSLSEEAMVQEVLMRTRVAYKKKNDRVDEM